MDGAGETEYQRFPPLLFLFDGRAGAHMNEITRAANAILQRVGYLVIWSHSTHAIGEIVPEVRENGHYSDDTIPGPLVIVAETTFEDFARQTEIVGDVPIETLRRNLSGFRFWRSKAE